MGPSVTSFGVPRSVPGSVPARSATVFPVAPSASKTQCAVGRRSGFGAALVGPFRNSATARTATTHAADPPTFAHVFAIAHRG